MNADKRAKKAKNMNIGGKIAAAFTIGQSFFSFAAAKLLFLFVRNASQTMNTKRRTKEFSIILIKTKARAVPTYAIGSGIVQQIHFFLSRKQYTEAEKLKGE